MTAVPKIIEFSGISSVISVIYAQYDLFKLFTCFSANLRAVSPGIVCSIERNSLNGFLKDLD